MIRRGSPRPRPGHGLPGAHIRRRRAVHSPGHRLAPRPGPAPDRVRPRVDRPIGTRAAAGQAVLYQHRLRPGPGDLHDRPAAGHLRRFRRSRDLSDQPAADPDPPGRHRGHSRGRPAGPLAAGPPPSTGSRPGRWSSPIPSPRSARLPCHQRPTAKRTRPAAFCAQAVDGLCTTASKLCAGTEMLGIPAPGYRPQKGF